MKVLKTLLHLILRLMINLSKRRIIKNSKATGTGRENVKRKEREKGNESGKGRGNVNAREIESAVIREVEVGAMTGKEAVVEIMAAVRVIEGLQLRPLRKREEMGTTTEINIRGKMITPNSNYKKRLQT